MKGPAELIRSTELSNYKNVGPIFEWEEGKTYLIVDHVEVQGVPGAILCYSNPPVHQVGNPGLDAYLEGLERAGEKGGLRFLILYGPNDPVHAGGDLKESLTRLDRTMEIKKEKEAAGAPPEELDQLYDWADGRLEKGIALHGKVRDLAADLRVVAVCGGGMRFGGSAEIALMADYIVGDSRSGMCFSEAMIGLVPGWSGVARALVKAGPLNTSYMAKISREVKAGDLLETGIYNSVVEVALPFPRKEKVGDPEEDKRRYQDALREHDRAAGLLLLPEGLRIAVCPHEEIPGVRGDERAVLAREEDIREEALRRGNPETYSELFGRPLAEVRDRIRELGRPLAPQSVEALDRLLKEYSASSFDERGFVRREADADALLYRDPRLRAGLVATLGQTVADYRG